MAEELTNTAKPGQRLESAEWNRLRQEILSRDGHQCVNCGAQTNLEVHHVVPLQRGGTNKRTNLTTVCRPCHNDSHDQQVSDPNTGTKDERWLSAVDEVRELVRTTHHPLKRAVIGLLAKTGIGVGELCNIQLRDVFFSDTDVSEAYGIGKPEWVQGSLPSIRIRAEGKETYSPQRERVGTTHIPFDNQTRRILKRWLAIRPDSHQSPRPLFLSTQSGGDRLSLMTVHALVKSQAISLGFADDDSELNSLTPYTLRYFFSERFLAQPTVREYILKGQSEPVSFEEVSAHYTNNIFKI